MCLQLIDFVAFVDFSYSLYVLDDIVILFGTNTVHFCICLMLKRLYRIYTIQLYRSEQMKYKCTYCTHTVSKIQSRPSACCDVTDEFNHHTVSGLFESGCDYLDAIAFDEHISSYTARDTQTVHSLVPLSLI